jgi:hypothetical protein
VPPLELTTTFKAISTSPKARKSHTPAAATGRVKAAARYALRDTAAPEGEVAWAGNRLDACPDRKAARLAFGQAVEERSNEGGAVGRRLASTLIVSLPNDWPKAAQVEAMNRLTAHLAPPGSEAIAIGAVHRDKPHNTHMHFVVLDGLEHPDAAVLRAHGRARGQVEEAPTCPPPTPPKRASWWKRLTRQEAPPSPTPPPPPAKAPVRIRRRNVLRLNELGRPKELRRELAAIINTVAAERGLEGVEWRSFEARGIDKTPTTHDGPQKRARKAKEATQQPAQVVEPVAPTLPPTPVPQPFSFGPIEPPPALPIAPLVSRPGGVREAVAIAAPATTKTITIQPEVKPKALPRWMKRKAKDDEER